MKIVITNDDGIDAPGLAALQAACAPLGEAVIVAPAREQSGVGHSLTVRGHIEIDEVGRGRWCVHGTPADCARIALAEIAPDADLLLSGINRGGNLGADIYTSGTVAAAREAALLGRRAIALSQYVARDRALDWDVVATRALHLLEDLAFLPVDPRVYLNVNLPHPEHDGIALERRLCPVDTNPLEVRFRREERILRYHGDYHLRPRSPGSDVDTCFGGMIAISALSVETPGIVPLALDPRPTDPELPEASR